MKVKKIYKYRTGHTIPEGAVYLGTVRQTEEYNITEWVKCWYVWHYFLVEVEEETN